MKYLRITHYASAGDPTDIHATTVVAPESALRTPRSYVEQEGLVEVPGSLVVTQEFEADTDDLPMATMLGMNLLSARAERERNMAILYFYDAAMLHMTSERGSLINPAPAPLSADEIATVFRQLRDHPNYKGQRVRCTCETGGSVILRDGSVWLP